MDHDGHYQHSFHLGIWWHPAKSRRCWPERSWQSSSTAMRVMAKKAAAGAPGKVPLDGVDEEKMDMDDDLQGIDPSMKVWIVARP